MKIHIPDFTDLRVLIIGDVMLDRYWHGDTSRISPEAPVPIVHIRERDERAGGAGNVALNTSSLGVQTILMGMIGNDADGNNLENILTKANINCILQRNKKGSTIMKLRVLGRNQQLIRLDFEEKLAPFLLEKQLSVFKEQLRKADIVILSDYDKGTLLNANELIAAACAANVPVLIDPKQRSFSAYRRATLLTPNMQEFETVAGPVTSLEELEIKAQQQLLEHDLQALLITRSEQGMSLIKRDEAPLHIPTQAKEVYDVTGAGDTVIATLACAIAAGESWQDAMRLANVAAGIAISKVGAVSVSVNELRRAVHSEHFSSNGIVTAEQLKLLVEDARAHGETVVMTNGCFDLLHAGHLAYLEEAKKLGDRLLVAVNDDASVRRLKGVSRPINNLQQRMTVLAGLTAVDWVTSFTEDTPEELICDLLPQILVKGGDYQIEDIIGSEHVIANGGSVKVLCFADGLSTSQLIKKIKQETA